MKVTNKGLDLIKEFEGWQAKAYRDAVGVWTIGYGHTSAAGLPVVKPGMVITEEEGLRILRKDVEAFAVGVRRAVKVDLNDSQFSALVSFAYNLGLGTLKTSSVLKAVNAKDFKAVPALMMRFVKARKNGKLITLNGLVRRRKAEGALFMAKPAKSVKPAPDVIAHAEQTETAGRVETEAPAPSTGNGTAAGGAGAVIVGGGAAVAAGFPWERVVMIGGIAAFVALIIFLVIKLRKQP